MEQIDEVDLALLRLLQDDASLSNVALAEQLRLSPPTCLRRVKRLRTLGLIDRIVAHLNPQALAHVHGLGLHAIVEVTLDRQGSEHLQSFEQRACADTAVQQCWRVSPGPDFVLVTYTPDMPNYLALTQRLFTQDANVRNVKAYFATHRAKLSTRIPL